MRLDILIFLVWNQHIHSFTISSSSRDSFNNNMHLSSAVILAYIAGAVLAAPLQDGSNTISMNDGKDVNNVIMQEKGA